MCNGFRCSTYMNYSSVLHVVVEEEAIKCGTIWSGLIFQWKLPNIKLLECASEIVPKINTATRNVLCYRFCKCKTGEFGLRSMHEIVELR